MRTYLERNIGFKVSNSMLNLMIYIPLLMIAYIEVESSLNNLQMIAFAISIPLFIMSLISMTFPNVINQLMIKITKNKYDKKDESNYGYALFYQVNGFILLILSYLFIIYLINS
jgi:hypothetical protein